MNLPRARDVIIALHLPLSGPAPARLVSRARK